MSTKKRVVKAKEDGGALAPTPERRPLFYIFCGGQREAEEIIRRFALPPQEAIVLRDADQVKGIPVDTPIVCLKGVGWRRHSQADRINSGLAIRSASIWEEEF